MPRAGAASNQQLPQTATSRQRSHSGRSTRWRGRTVPPSQRADSRPRPLRARVRDRCSPRNRRARRRAGCRWRPLPRRDKGAEIRQCSLACIVPPRSAQTGEPASCLSCIVNSLTAVLTVSSNPPIIHCAHPMVRLNVIEPASCVWVACASFAQYHATPSRAWTARVSLASPPVTGTMRSCMPLSSTPLRCITPMTVVLTAVNQRDVLAERPADARATRKETPQQSRSYECEFVHHG